MEGEPDAGGIGVLSDLVLEGVERGELLLVAQFFKEVNAKVGTVTIDPAIEQVHFEPCLGGIRCCWTDTDIGHAGQALVVQPLDANGEYAR